MDQLMSFSRSFSLFFYIRLLSFHWTNEKDSFEWKIAKRLSSRCEWCSLHHRSFLHILDIFGFIFQLNRIDSVIKKCVGRDGFDLWPIKNFNNWLLKDNSNSQLWKQCHSVFGMRFSIFFFSLWIGEKKWNWEWKTKIQQIFRWWRTHCQFTFGLNQRTVVFRMEK